MTLNPRFNIWNLHLTKNEYLDMWTHHWFHYCLRRRRRRRGKRRSVITYRVFTRSSKRPALARLCWIQLLEVCWTFAESCKHPINFSLRERCTALHGLQPMGRVCSRRAGSLYSAVGNCVTCMRAWGLSSQSVACCCVFAVCWLRR